MSDAQEHIARRTITHPVQLHILQRLIFNRYQSYPELLPDGLSGHGFGYHLRQLQVAGLITKSPEGYTLTPSGRLTADASSFETFKLKSRPVIGVFLDARTPQGQVVVYRSNRAPLYNHVTLPFGKLRLGETYSATLARLLGRAQFVATSDPTWTALNVCFQEDTQLVSHRTGAKATITIEQPKNLRQTPNGSYLLVDPEQADVRLAELNNRPDVLVRLDR